MRIVYILRESPIPSNSGGRIRYESLWRSLTSVGNVRLIVLGDKPPLWVRRQLYEQNTKIFPPYQDSSAHKAVRQLCAFFSHKSMKIAKAMSHRRVEHLVEEVQAESPDVIVLGDTFMAPLTSKLKQFASRVVVDTHNVESRLFARQFKQSWDFSKILSYLCYRNALQMENHLRHADEVWAVSEEDATYYRKTLKLERVTVMPNVIDLARYDSLSSEEEGAIVFTGLYSYWPNHDAAMRLIAFSKRLKNEGICHRLYLVGRSPTRKMLNAVQGQEQIIVTGEVPDTRPYLAKASVVAAPLSAGSGTKLKVLEAMAFARPVLTTPIGAEGLDLVWSKDVVVAESTESFYCELRRLLSDVEMRWTIGRTGREWVESQGSLENLKRNLATALA